MCDWKQNNKICRIYETGVDTAYFLIHVYILININQS